MHTGLPRPLALVTGAADGIGLGMATQLAENGFDLVLADEGMAVTAVAARLTVLGGTVEPVLFDPTDYGSVEQLCYTIEKISRPVEALVISSTTALDQQLAGTASLDAELQLIDIHLTTTVHLVRRMVTAMMENNTGRVLLASSIPTDGSPIRAGLHAFLSAFGSALRNELIDTPITVTVVEPPLPNTADPTRGEVLLSAPEIAALPPETASTFGAFMKGAALAPRPLPFGSAARGWVDGSAIGKLRPETRTRHDRPSNPG